MSENINDYVIIDQEPPSLIDKLKSIPMTYYIAGANIFVFIMIHLTNFFIGDNWLLMQLWKSTPDIALNGQSYRLLTAVFTHNELMHILGNCMGLIILGRPIEQIFGKWKLLIIFLVSGLFGSLASFIFSPAYAIGASGGVFGLFGVHFYLLMINKKVYLKVFGNEIFKLLLLNVLIGFTVSGIDYYGHFGGIFGGFLATLALGLNHKIKFNKRFFAVSIAMLVIFFGSFSYVKSNYVNFINDFETNMNQFNTAANANDLHALKEARDNYKQSIPHLPPIPNTDYVLEQLDQIIKKAE
ncbi:rhomboid family intramembrane serine protease [Acidaminobacter sp. JC074]|uniref:rhomboid family intramembrane serine protease n=1 Tax=Acidaminobacter sp. JC074 TaxID=2530199 RepID=UPI001F0FA072|nr:rhomboid family intramembrane serine protease [Acidaminobacter sp. JC074]MCH4890359.1 rhomboid family intramembrane serine protease [Acidaminobacter sp. JC074]